MLSSLLDAVPVLPVAVVDDVTHAVPVARALVAGGLPAIELTLRTPVALDAIRAIAAEVPEILVGAGTVTTPDQARLAAEAGARFLVSPGLTPSLLSSMRDTGLRHRCLQQQQRQEAVNGRRYGMSNQSTHGRIRLLRWRA